ncbi:MAG: hypothetical protein KGP35_09205 [Bacteroidetes bacterium]|nr:hypothetical protein [Bacteroidota bacterium]
MNALKLYLALFFGVPVISIAQNISGQWKGSFNEKNSTDATEYVLEVEVKGKNVEGTSVTYFTIRGKRYFTMCAITGSYDPATKTIVAKEISKVKANTPDWFNDCFQTHTLTYFKKGESEELSGNWKSARPEENCGKGTTLLSRKVLVKKKPTADSHLVKNEKKPTQSAPVTADVPKVKEEVVTTETIQDIQSNKVESIEDITTESGNKLEKRVNKIFETIELDEEEIYVSIFDNAEVDGDIITVLFNGAVVLTDQLLSDKPISFSLKAKKGVSNTLTMYSVNQGKTPPNTAIMRIKNGETYHKILLSADDKQNASIVLKTKGQ